MKLHRIPHLLASLLFTVFGISSALAESPAPAKGELPASFQTGAPIEFELWSWGEDEAGRKKIRDIKEGDHIPLAGLPDEVQFRFRVPVDHNGIVFKGKSADGQQRLGWDTKNEKDSTDSAGRLYRAQADGYFPQPCRYCLQVKASKGDEVVADIAINFDFVKAPLKPVVRNVAFADSVGMLTPFPKSSHAGAAVQHELWQWEGKDKKKLIDLKDGAKIPVETLPKSIQIQSRVATEFDGITCRWRSSDGYPERIWPQKNLPPAETGPQHLFVAGNLGFFPQIGKYCIEVTAEKAGKVVAQDCINIELVRGKPIPTNTTFMAGRKDWKGNAITTSKPVNLGPLNETPVLKDNDYAFAPQKAYATVNWERFPPFRMNPRFPMVWDSRRFDEEDKFGGPLNRGFTTLANIDPKQDNLKISERSHFDYPGHLEGIIDSLYKKDPVQYKDLKPWKDRRSTFVSKENTLLLGKRIYEEWNVMGWSPYDAGIHAWDEEQMFAPIATLMMKEHPDELPERILQYKDKVLAGDKRAIGIIERAFDKEMAEFVGNTYKAAKDSAAERGRTVKIWHYGSKPIGNELFMFVGGTSGAELNQKTGKYPYEEMSGLNDWFKKGQSVDFDATAYSREIDYFHDDFYFHILFPEEASMYQKDKAGAYVLDDKGRRKIRTDVISESNYTEPVKVGFGDYEWAPIFLKSFVAKGENCLFWSNGGKYYKTPSTLITSKMMMPYIRPSNQATFGDSSKFGDRPISPYMAEATTILTFMIGCEGTFVWDAPKGASPVGFAPNGKPGEKEMLGDLEYYVKGLHRVSQFNRLFDGNYSFIRPTRLYNTHNRDHPIIRGLVNGQYLVLAMLNPYLDPGEHQDVEVWYDAPYASRTTKWAGNVAIQARKNHLFQCKLPALPAGQQYDPDKLYFRYTLKDGNYSETFTVSGNYDVKYPY